MKDGVYIIEVDKGEQKVMNELHQLIDCFCLSHKQIAEMYKRTKKDKSKWQIGINRVTGKVILSFGDKELDKITKHPLL